MYVNVVAQDSEIVDRGSTEQKRPHLEIMDVIHTDTEIIMPVAEGQELDSTTTPIRNQLMIEKEIGLKVNSVPKVTL